MSRSPQRPSLTPAQSRVLRATFANQPIRWPELLRVARATESATITRLHDLGLTHETTDGFVSVTALGEATAQWLLGQRKAKGWTE